MKNIFFYFGVLISFVFLTFFPLHTNSQDSSEKERSKKRLKLVKIKDGESMVLDTVIEDDNIFVWNGDTIFNREDFDFDFDFEFETEGEGEERVFVMKHGKGTEPFVFHFEGLDSLKELKTKIKKDVDKALGEIRVWKDEDGRFIIPDIPRPPKVPHAFHFKNSENSIDLNDPGIISYERKEKRDGTEKITILRENPDKEEE